MSSRLYIKFVEEDDKHILKVFRRLFIISRLQRRKLTLKYFHTWKDLNDCDDPILSIRNSPIWNEKISEKRPPSPRPISIVKIPLPSSRKPNISAIEMEEHKKRQSISTITYQVEYNLKKEDSNTISKPISKINTPGRNSPFRRNMKRNETDVFFKLYEVILI